MMQISSSHTLFMTMPPRECPRNMMGLPLAPTLASLKAPSISSAKVNTLPVVVFVNGIMNARES
jgi:hypothetical protein